MSLALRRISLNFEASLRESNQVAVLTLLAGVKFPFPALDVLGSYGLNPWGYSCNACIADVASSV